MKPPKLAKPRVESLSDDELERLVKACRGSSFADRRDEALVRLLAATGMRAGEVMALRVEDVDLRGGQLRVRHSKNGKARVVGFSPVVARSLDRYLRARRSHRLADLPDVWLGEQGRRFGYQGLSRALKQRAVVAGIDGFHVH